VRIPRISILGMMGLVGLLAVDSWAYSVFLRRVVVDEVLGWLLRPLATTLLTANALAIGFYLLYKGSVGNERARPFLVGFVAAGTVSMGLAAVASKVFPVSIDTFFIAVLNASLLPMLKWAGLDHTLVGLALVVTAMMALLALPQLIAAVLGGLITRRYGIKLAMERRRQASPLPDPPAVSAVC
jgi:hypothetical protein